MEKKFKKLLLKFYETKQIYKLQTLFINLINNFIFSLGL